MRGKYKQCLLPKDFLRGRLQHQLELPSTRPEIALLFVCLPALLASHLEDVAFVLGLAPRIPANQ